MDKMHQPHFLNISDLQGQIPGNGYLMATIAQVVQDDAMVVGLSLLSIRD